MNKKLICLVLSLVMLLTASVAFAAPSKTTGDLNTVLGASDTTITLAPLAATDTAVLEAISAFVKDGASVIGYFADVKDQITALLPSGTDADKLVMNEFTKLVVSGYDPATGDVSMTFSFATTYADGAKLVAVAGLTTSAGTTWTPVRAMASNGAVVVFFPASLLQAINNGDAVLAILSESTAS